MMCVAILRPDDAELAVELGALVEGKGHFRRDPRAVGGMHEIQEILVAPAKGARRDAEEEVHLPIPGHPLRADLPIPSAHARALQGDFQPQLLVLGMIIWPGGAIGRWGTHRYLFL